ncbi:MAG TPA: hypothetical protein VKA21_15665 [Candidatus Binatia bacterium]|nr:hypothetical protein [Candidatus Binatia bacterium]
MTAGPGTAPSRDGAVTCVRAGDRWNAEIRLDGQERIALARAFATEDAAARAGAEILAEWRAGRSVLRDLVLRELAAAYRGLRERHKMTEPAAVPTTSAAWDRAILEWERLGWLQADDVTRYREHVLRAFGAGARPVRRCGTVGDVESDVG